MIERRLAVGEKLAEDRQQAEVEAHFTAKRQRCRGSAEQGRQWADRAQSSRQRSGMHSGRWAEAAHLFQPNLAPNLKMLSSGRHRAGRFVVAKLSTARAFALATAERVFTHRLALKVCVKTPSGVIAHGLLHVESFPAMDGSAGDPTSGCPS